MKEARQTYTLGDALEDNECMEWDDCTLEWALSQARDWLDESPYSEEDIYQSNRWFLMDEEGNETDVRAEWRSE